MKDFFGQEIKIGDRVIIPNSGRGRSKFHVRYVYGFCAKTVKLLSCTPDPRFGRFWNFDYISPDNIIVDLTDYAPYAYEEREPDAEGERLIDEYNEQST
jgi:hypothetical protein